jgi:TRAP-type transport system small permease protein
MQEQSHQGKEPLTPTKDQEPKNQPSLEKQVQQERKRAEINLVQQQTRFMKYLWRISQIMSGVGAVLIGAMMFVTVIDVGGRYFFMTPLNGAAELVGLLLVVAGTWGMGFCQLHKMNVRISVLTDKLSPRGKNMMWVLAYIISTLVAGAVAWQGYLQARGYMINKLGSVTDVLGMPLWPFWLLMSIGFTWACFIFIIDLAKVTSEVFKK